jgi:hypothetical protein
VLIHYFCAVCDAKTAEFKFFKKLCEQSGHRSHSYKHSHLSVEQNVFKQEQGADLYTLSLLFYDVDISLQFTLTHPGSLYKLPVLLPVSCRIA